MINQQIAKFNGSNFKFFPRDQVDESVIAEIFKWREYRSAEPIIGEAREAIIDVGAHVGVFTLYARALNPSVKIFCLEPEPNNFSALKKHFQENKIKNVVLKMMALAKTKGKRKLLVADDNQNHRLISDEELPDTAHLIAVEASGLADFCRTQKIEKISLLKMDIEGGEYEILENLSPAEAKLIENLILEFHDGAEKNHKQIETALREKGFSVQIFPSQFDKKLGFILAKNKRGCVI